MPASTVKPTAFVASIVAVASIGMAASIAVAESLSVAVENKSQPQLCAEKDNVTLTFTNASVRGFTIEAEHPAYIGAVREKSHAPDWTACDFGPPTGEKYVPPVKVTIYEDVALWVTGYRFSNFWRKRKVPFTVAGKTDDSFDLIQIWIRHDERAEEVLVLYPPDGYWRARPLPSPHLGWSAYGSSFVIGPLTSHEGRPVVDIQAIEFDPRTRVFSLAFAGGQRARVAIGVLDRARQELRVAFDKAIAGRPFAALRSMYVTKLNNDVAEVAVLEAGANAWRESPVMSFKGTRAATKLWAGRHIQSRHNTSAPDMLFFAFSDKPQLATEAQN